MTLLNILNGLTLIGLLKVVAGIILILAFYYTVVWLAQKPIDKDRDSANRAVAYNQKHKRHSTEWTKQLGEDTQKENEYLVKTGFPEQNKRLGI